MAHLWGAPHTSTLSAVDVYTELFTHPNIIRKGYNYGFPLVMGYTDGNYDGSRAGDGSTMPYVPSEVVNQALIEAKFPYSGPITSLFPAEKSLVSDIYNNDVNNTSPYPNYYLQWPTSAPSGIDYYASDAIPGWKSSLLVSNLKLASVFRLKLAPDGESVISDTIGYFHGLGRFRDIALSADGTKIFVAADSVGAIKGAPGVSGVPPNKGCILEFTYLTVGTDDPVLAEKVKIAPNPTNRGLTKLSLGLDEAAEVFVELFSVTGQRMGTILQPEKAKTVDRIIDMGKYPPGSYFLKVHIDDRTIVKKLMHF